MPRRANNNEESQGKIRISTIAALLLRRRRIRRLCAVWVCESSIR